MKRAGAQFFNANRSQIGLKSDSARGRRPAAEAIGLWRKRSGFDAPEITSGAPGAAIVFTRRVRARWQTNPSNSR